MVNATCAVRECMSSSYITKDVRFHQFPHTEERCKVWIEACRRPDLIGKLPNSLKHMYICSLHFEGSMYGKKHLKKTATPVLHLPVKYTHSVYTQSDLNSNMLSNLQPSVPQPGASAAKRPCYCLAAGTSHEGPPQKLARSAPSAEATAYCEPEHQTRSEVPLHPDFRCKVCNNDIIGFRYTCIQCAHWDMCAACEARGEHPAHYVLRLPAPKPNKESEAVLASIRIHIEELLALKNEMHKVLIKEERIEVKHELELDITEHDPIQLNDSIVPEANIRQNSSAIIASDGCSNSVCTDAATGHARADELGQSQERAAAMLPDIKQEPQEYFDTLVIDEANSNVKTEGKRQTFQKLSYEK